MNKIDFDPLRLYLNELSTDEKNNFAAECGTSLGYMRKRMSLKKPFGFAIAKNIAKRGIMQPSQLRPTDYGDYLWS